LKNYFLNELLNHSIKAFFVAYLIICTTSFYLVTTLAIWPSSTQDYYQHEATLERSYYSLSSSSP